eukprot:scaffold137983_cov199-Phaeocystis_antarctica.AAC.1
MSRCCTSSAVRSPCSRGRGGLTGKPRALRHRCRRAEWPSRRCASKAACPALPPYLSSPSRFSVSLGMGANVVEGDSATARSLAPCMSWSRDGPSSSGCTTAVPRAPGLRQQARRRDGARQRLPAIGELKAAARVGLRLAALPPLLGLGARACPGPLGLLLDLLLLRRLRLPGESACPLRLGDGLAADRQLAIVALALARRRLGWRRGGVGLDVGSDAPVVQVDVVVVDRHVCACRRNDVNDDVVVRADM